MTLQEALYQSGIVPARHPVPAIALTVFITSTHVVIEYTETLKSEDDMGSCLYAHFDETQWPLED